MRRHGRNRWRGERRDTMSDDVRVGIRAALDPHFDVSAFQLKLGDIPFDQEIYKLFQLFLVHECMEALSDPIGSNTDAPKGFRDVIA